MVHQDQSIHSQTSLIVPGSRRKAEGQKKTARGRRSQGNGRVGLTCSWEARRAAGIALQLPGAASRWWLQLPALTTAARAFACRLRGRPLLTCRRVRALQLRAQTSPVRVDGEHVGQV